MSDANDFKRQYNIDNIKCLLMFLVVFGHCLETFEYYGGIYRIIYLFHMPAFIFISGYFMRFSLKKLLVDYLYPYVIFQILYLAFDSLFISGDMFEIQFTNPYWILWYLMVMILYCLLSKVISIKNNLLKVFIFMLSVVIMLISGYNSKIGRYLSLSRFFNFMPFFIAGYYGGKSDKFKHIIKNTYIKFFSLLFSIIFSMYVFINKEITKVMLYGSYSYDTAHYGPIIQLKITVMAFVIILALFTSFENKKIKLISRVGKNTLTIYLIHGFILRLIKKYHLLDCGELINIFLSVVITVIILLILSNEHICKIFSYITSGRWIEKTRGNI